ncbi:MAG: DUF2236 domain-containing protein [Cyclobacteriaceae bacterium]|nr:DUF2236 domain-containing protein [Cyclobacteriaceae bacterium]MCH8515971.1 DUF2236 domain-containing protein [Cyclobacteriaceae bacterium]
MVNTNISFDALRQEGDPLADAVIAEAFDSANGKKALFQYLSELKTNHLPEASPAGLSQLEAYMQEALSAPSEEEINEMKLGMSFMQAHTGEILAMLGLLSLPYCYAAAEGAKVLMYTKRLSYTPGKRLLETAEFVLSLCDPAAFSAEGCALAQIAKVRLIHAAVRYHHRQGNPNYYEMPVNQEDLLGTHLAFSLLVVRAFRKMQIPIDSHTANHYLKYWQWIGTRLGIQPDLLPANQLQASELERKIRKRQFHASEDGKKLTAELMQYIQASAPNAAYKTGAPYYSRYLMGDEVADMIGLPQNSLATGLLQANQVREAINAFFGSAADGSYEAALAQFKQQASRTAGFQSNQNAHNLNPSQA